jgi:hypothetical protein
MGRFYFHLAVGNQRIPDEEGEDLPNASEARREAVRSAREILAAAIRHGQPRAPDAIVIADDAGRTLDTIRLASVLPESFK